MSNHRKSEWAGDSTERAGESEQSDSVKSKANRWIFSALKKIGQDHHFKRIDFFNAFIIGQKQSSFLLNGRGDLQGIGQSDRVTCPNERRSLPQLLVNRRDGKRRKRLEREFDFVGQREVFVGKRFCKNLGECDGRSNGAQSMIFQQAKYRIEEIGVGGNVLDIINERCGIETDNLVLSMARRSLRTFPFIAQLLDVGVDLGSIAPGSLTETAQANRWALRFGPENDFVALYDSG